jgi:orotidine-5'-phosphate decarboxylase
VLVLTSNPEGREVQTARVSDGRTVAGAILAWIAACNAGARPLGSIGAVVGATVGAIGEDLQVNGPLLAPGLGAQGGTADDLRRVFGDVLRNVVPSVSRSVLAAGPDHARLRTAARRTSEEIAAVLARD